MSSIAHTQPRTGRRSFNLRAYLAGTAATAALIGAVVLAFASLGAYVAFNGLPIGGAEADIDASVAVDPAAAPEPARARANAQDAANANVRRTQGTQADRAGNGGGAETSQTTASPADTPVAPTPGGGEPTVATGGAGGTVTPTPAQTGPSDDPPSSQVPSPQVTAPGAVGGTVGTVEQTLHGAGVDVPITGSGSPVDDVTGLVGGH